MNLFKNKKDGYTLIEMMITVAIIGVLAALAVPSYNRFIAHQNLNAAVRELFSDIRGARVTAIKEGVQYGIYFPSATQFWVIKVANAPTYTSFAQANAAGVSPVYTVSNTYNFSQLGYNGVTMAIPNSMNMPVFQKSGAVSSVSNLTSTPAFSTSAPTNVTFTSNYGETRVVSVNIAGFAQIQ